MAELIKEENIGPVMKNLGACDISVAIMKQKGIFKRIFVKDVRNAMANIIKQDMLSIGGDVAVHEGCINCSIDKSDILILGTMKEIRLLIKKMKTQVSELPKIAKEVEKLLSDS